MYEEIQVSFLRLFTDAYICDDRYLYLISLFARPMVSKAAAAAIVQGREVSIGAGMGIKRVSDELKVLTHNFGDITHKVIYAPHYFHKGGMVRIVVGEDLNTAFDFIDSVISTPLKREWKQWLWENGVKKKKLTGFGEIDGVKLDPVYLVRPIDHRNEIYDDMVLNAIESGEIN